MLGETSTRLLRSRMITIRGSTMGIWENMVYFHATQLSKWAFCHLQQENTCSVRASNMILGLKKVSVSGAFPCRIHFAPPLNLPWHDPWLLYTLILTDCCSFVKHRWYWSNGWSPFVLCMFSLQIKIHNIRIRPYWTNLLSQNLFRFSKPNLSLSV